MTTNSKETNTDISVAVEQTLEKTDFGHVINQNKNLILIASAVVVALIGAYSIFDYQKIKSNSQKLDAVYEFQKDIINPFLEDKVEVDAFVKNYETSMNEELYTSALYSKVALVVEKLIEKQRAGSALSILEQWEGQFDKKSDEYFFVALKLSSLYEDSSKYSKALNLYQFLMAHPLKVLKSKVYLNAGRMNLKLGNKQQAKMNFEHITKNFPASSDNKLAQLYLNTL
jgi:predicted negative regulator of RcsB-dependent stress response